MTTSPDDHEKYQYADPLSAEAVPAGVIVSPDTRRAHRIPPGQTRTRKWPVLHYGRVPLVPLESWRLEVTGLVERPLSLNWHEFRALPRVQVYGDFHCVTTWSRLGNIWEGVSARWLLEQAGIEPSSRFVVLGGYDDGWTTNMPLADFLEADVLLADTHDGTELTAEHGGPLRAIVPRLYAWKSAKWLRSIELVAEDRPGLWEQEGYHNHGDPWTEERFGK